MIPNLGLLAVFAICGLSAGHAQQPHQVLHNHVNPAVTGGQAALVGTLPLEQQMHVSIVLPLRNQTELTDLLKRLYDPSSPDYRQFLSVDEFTERFGPTVDDYLAVAAFAQANGFTITASPANRLVVPVSGTVDQINKAFNVRMSVYQHPTENRTFFSPDREPSLNLSVPVAHISGLNNFSLPYPAVIPPRNVQSEAGPVTGSGPFGSYLASDMRAAYYGGTTLNGNGQAVGLLEFAGYDLNDVNSTFSTVGQTYNVAINNVLLDGATGTPISGDNAEAEVVLDIVQAIGMAPGLSQVRVYIGQGEDDANLLNSMASENIAKQISSSWSWTPDDPQTDDVFFGEFAAQGQSFFDASGDSGAYDASINPFFYPAEDAYVTAVGGTHLTTNGPGGSWFSEVAWNSSGDGSGGGISPDGIALPSWQSGVANTSNGGSATLRNVPDVAMEGDFDNYLCALGSCEEGWAGTSFAAPRWAGFMALVNQQAVEAGTAPKGGVGFINPALYGIGEGSSYSNDLHDITSGNNDTENQPLWYSAVSGYDLVTGWGSPTGPDLIDDLAGPQTPGFWILGSPATVSVTQGSSSTTTFTLTDAGGFTGDVTLAVTSALPSGVTASWGTNPTAGTSVLTLTASSTAPSSTTPVTITGTSGSLTATTSITVAVHAPTFALSATPNNLGINPGASGTSTVTVTPEYGFTGNVNLTIFGLPTGVTASFAPATTSSSSTLTLNVNSTAVGGTSTLTITGTSGNLTVTTFLTLTVQAPTFMLSTYGTVNIGQGTSVSSYVYVYSYYGFSGNVNLSVSGLPSGVTASFSPNPASASSASLLTFTASNSATQGQYTLTITGTSGSITASTSLPLVVHQPTFTLPGPGSMDLGQGSTGTDYIYIYPQYGFTGNVTMSVSGLPSGVTALWTPNPITSNTNLTLSVSKTAAVGTSTLTITGTSGGIIQTTTLALNVHAPTFTLSGGWAVDIGQGTTGTAYVYVNQEYGFTGSVNLAVSGLPNGVTASFSPNPSTGYSMLTLTASSTAPLGTTTLTVTGTSGNITATTTVTLGIFTPTFSISSSFGVNVGQGSSGTAYVYVNSQYGFNGNVTMSISGLPSGITASFAPNPTTGYSVVTLNVSNTAALGTSTMTITGTSGSQTATTTLSVSVYAPTFSLSDYGSVTMNPGSTTTTYVSVDPQYGFSGSVNLSVSGLPAGVTASFSPNPTTGGSTLTLTASSTAPVGQFTLTITGTSGTLTATTTLSLGIYTPTFSLYGGGS